MPLSHLSSCCTCTRVGRDATPHVTVAAACVAANSQSSGSPSDTTPPWLESVVCRAGNLVTSTRQGQHVACDDDDDHYAEAEMEQNKGMQM
uniref:Uncharacterized protein n=1 Tax=Oryza punctata TaxID=4537 RepID=A0A0E0K2D2_ORYPU